MLTDTTDAERFQLSVGAPAWLQFNLSQPGVSGFVELDGAPIHYLTWDWHRRERPALILVHGYRAHAHWWSFLAPFFLSTHRVAAIDLSGMGDSGHRLRYNGLRLALDIAGFIDRFDLAPATVIAHSFGGSRTLRAAAERPDAIGHAIIVDTYVNLPDLPPLPSVAPIEPRTYSDRMAVQARFRLLPPQPVAVGELVRYVAHHSVVRRSGGWSWKFDPRLPSDEEPDGSATLARIRVKVDYVYGESSVVAGGGRAQRIFRSLAGARELVMIPGAHHHLMLDHPLELVASLQKLLCRDA